ncbi:DUF2975 domain-containing protein [Microbacterium sp.]|uniref:DUF2975 domain-containing protein n=1 Tax=Microbacterium sp. TaxID=51671 RepID=UPI0039E506A0
MDPATPRPSTGLIVATHVFLGVLFTIGLVAGISLPGVSASLAQSFPEYAELRGPLLAVAMSFTALGLIALVVIALLVHRIYTGAMLTRPSLLWVDAIVALLVLGIALIVTAVVVIGSGQAGSPFMALVLALACLTLAALASLTLVLRSLLRGAILLRAELDEVV